MVFSGSEGTLVLKSDLKSVLGSILTSLADDIIRRAALWIAWVMLPERAGVATSGCAHLHVIQLIVAAYQLLQASIATFR